MKSSFITGLLLAIIFLNNNPCYADDPCQDPKKRVEVLAEAMNDDIGAYWTGMPVDGTFRTVEHTIGHGAKWFEISYISKGNIVAVGIIQGFSSFMMEGLTVKVTEGGQKLELTYFSGKYISCTFSIVPTSKEGFKVIDKNK